MEQTAKRRSCVLEDESFLYFSNGVVKLTFSKRTGHWIGLEYLPDGLVLMDSPKTKSSFQFRTGRERLSTALRDNKGPSIEDAQVIGKNAIYNNYIYRDSGSKAELCVCCREKLWKVWQSFILTSGSNIIEREISIKYLGEEEIKLQDVFLNLCNLKINSLKECLFQAPGYPIKPDFPAEDIPEDGWQDYESHQNIEMDSDVPGFLPGLFSLYNPSKGIAIFCWAYTPQEPSFIYPKREKDTVSFFQKIICADYLKKGCYITTGKQFILIPHGNWNKMLQEFHSLCQKKFDSESCADNKTPWSKVNIYEAHIGKAVFPKVIHEPFPTVNDLIAYLPKIKDFGFKVILLMPRQPYPSYSVHNYQDITTTFGEKKALKSLIKQAHAMGIYLILDIVLHGCIDKKAIKDTVERVGTKFNYVFDLLLKNAPEHSLYRKQHGDWFMRSEDGEIGMTYTLAFDSANENWQEYIIKALQFYIEELDVDGFRFDAPTWNFFINWDTSLPYRGSQSIYGAVELFRKAKDRLKKIKPNIIFYTEPSGPLFRANFDLNYNYDEHWLFGSILNMLSNPRYPGPYPREKKEQINAKELAQWLEYRNLVLPSGGETVHHIDSHDTFWLYDGHFPREVFGLEASKALFALCAFLDGGLMVYAGSEKNVEKFYSKIIHLRNSLPEMRFGKCEYTTVKSSDDMILPLFWQFKDNYSVPIINFKNSSVETNIYLPVNRMEIEKEETYLIWDAFNNTIVPCDSRGKIFLKLPPYGISVLVIRKYKQ